MADATNQFHPSVPAVLYLSIGRARIPSLWDTPTQRGRGTDTFHEAHVDLVLTDAQRQSLEDAINTLPFRKGQRIRVHHVDRYGYTGRDFHPTDSDVGLHGTVAYVDESSPDGDILHYVVLDSTDLRCLMDFEMELA